ncbi:HdeD family acid-resistance protein [Gulosibacter chungangensis]|uniref:HdeD family acid-resistance protein n=1 Tax=Gulosibacter chungangensis TaxID=979746 RepID=A0A7J5BBF3_9MICO|nr:DUF308 domain-containing protein [Gulosibacter chungangensis]KAB1642582.1 hypothetical protein F8O05_08905 [Gulosibacter chungangensis]
MSVESSTVTTKSIRTALGIGGLLALILGILILVWPGKTAMVVAAMIAVYAIITGIAYVVISFRAKSKGGFARVGHFLLGLLFLVAGIFAFVNLGATTVWLAAMLGIMVGIMWIVEGVVALSTLSDAPSKVVTAIFAVLSIIAGLMLVFSPYYIVALWWMLGISFVVLGILQIFRALRFGRSR